MNSFLHSIFQNIEKIYYFLAILGVLVAIIGLPILWWYADETYQLRKLSEKQLAFLSRPFLDFVHNEPYYTVTNKSTNVASNIFVFSMLSGNYYFIDDNEAVGSALKPGGKFFIDKKKEKQISPAELERRISSISPLIKHLNTKEVSCTVVVYEDLLKNKIYTTIYGSGDAYDKVIETEYINDLRN